MGEGEEKGRERGDVPESPWNRLASCVRLAGAAEHGGGGPRLLMGSTRAMTAEQEWAPSRHPALTLSCEL